MGRFREACDTFFNNKKLHFKDIDSEQSKNLELKKAIIEEARQFTLSGNAEEDINKLKDFQNRWAEIGFVPLNTKTLSRKNSDISSTAGSTSSIWMNTTVTWKDSGQNCPHWMPVIIRITKLSTKEKSWWPKSAIGTRRQHL